ncbi:Centrosomal protein [Trichinella spiralis]|uniref:Centrosomal protein n=1 Tax=Trichinella spiralis TaxID=6334 RepID=A0A0V1BQP5_TRISP|nr:Centrosomal protein [Trichinella spiralis]
MSGGVRSDDFDCFTVDIDEAYPRDTLFFDDETPLCLPEPIAKSTVIKPRNNGQLSDCETDESLLPVNSSETFKGFTNNSIDMENLERFLNQKEPKFMKATVQLKSTIKNDIIPEENLNYSIPEVRIDQAELDDIMAEFNSVEEIGNPASKDDLSIDLTIQAGSNYSGLATAPVFRSSSPICPLESEKMPSYLPVTNTVLRRNTTKEAINCSSNLTMKNLQWNAKLPNLENGEARSSSSSGFSNAELQCNNDNISDDVVFITDNEEKLKMFREDELQFSKNGMPVQDILTGSWSSSSNRGEMTKVFGGKSAPVGQINSDDDVEEEEIPTFGFSVHSDNDKTIQSEQESSRSGRVAFSGPSDCAFGSHYSKLSDKHNSDQRQLPIYQSKSNRLQEDEVENVGKKMSSVDLSEQAVRGRDSCTKKSEGGGLLKHADINWKEESASDSPTAALRRILFDCTSDYSASALAEMIMSTDVSIALRRMQRQAEAAAPSNNMPAIVVSQDENRSAALLTATGPPQLVDEFKVPAVPSKTVIRTKAPAQVPTALPQHADGHLEANKRHLSFGCVPLNSSVSNSVLVRYTSQFGQIRTRVSIKHQNQCFKLENVSSRTMMQFSANESHRLVVSFRPKSVGYQTGKILFRLEETKEEFVIRLYGYGGTACVMIADEKYLSPEKLVDVKLISQSNGNFHGKVTLKNTGSLPAFVKMVPYADPFAHEVLHDEKLTMEPKAFVMNCDSEMNVHFNVKKNDVPHNGIVAYVSLFWNEEVLRRNLRGWEKYKKKQFTKETITFTEVFEGEDRVVVDELIPASSTEAASFVNNLRKIVIKLTAEMWSETDSCLSFAALEMEQSSAGSRYNLSPNSCYSKQSTSAGCLLSTSASSFHRKLSRLPIPEKTMFRATPMDVRFKDTELHTTTRICVDFKSEESTSVNLLLDNDLFTLSCKKLDLVADKRQRIWIYFSPKEQGFHSGTLTAVADFNQTLHIPVGGFVSKINSPRTFALVQKAEKQDDSISIFFTPLSSLFKLLSRRVGFLTLLPRMCLTSWACKITRQNLTISKESSSKSSTTLSEMTTVPPDNNFTQSTRGPNSKENCIFTVCHS